MPRKAQKKYGTGGNYYRKKIKRPDGTYASVYGRTLTELAEKVTKARNELTAPPDVPPHELYVYEYCAAFYRRAAPHLSADRKKLYEYQINKVICPVIGSKPIVSVTLDDLKDVLATRAHLSRRSQEDTVQILKQIFSAAAEADTIPKDPSLKLKPGGKPPAQKQAITDTQQAQLLAAVRGLKVEPMVMLGLYTGMRRGEICGLRWDCVHLVCKSPYIQVRRACRWPDKIHPAVSETLKSPAALRDIPIPPQLTAYLRELKEAQKARIPGKDSVKAEKIEMQYVYGSDKGQPVSYSTLRRRWDTIRTRSTASGLAMGDKVKNHKITVTLDFMPTPHILRHTYVTRLVLSKMDLKRVQYLAGHSDPEITLQIYTSLQKAQPEAFDADDADA